MIRFLKKIMLFSVLVTVCFALIAAFDYFVIGSQFSYNYEAALIDKVERLVSINEPKIILVGNSNLAFGIHSDEIEKELNLPVVNLGLTAGLGNACLEQIARLNINKGDIVVVCHTSFSDDDGIPNPSVTWIAYDFNDSVWPVFRKKDYKTMLASYPNYVRKACILWITNRGNRVPNGYYSRTAFNEFGDVVYKPFTGQTSENKVFPITSVNVPEINDICVNRLNELAEYCVERGAAMVVAGYPIYYCRQYAESTENDLKNFREQLEAALDCDVISDYADYLYPYDYFYDGSQLHLTNEGAQIRTEQLIHDLKNWLGGYAGQLPAED